MTHEFEEVQLKREMRALKEGQEKFMSSITDDKADKQEDRQFYARKVMGEAIVELQERITKFKEQFKSNNKPAICKIAVKDSTLAGMTLEVVASSLHSEMELTNIALKLGKLVESENRWLAIYAKDEDHRHHWAIMRKASEMLMEKPVPGKLLPAVRAANFLKQREADINKSFPRLAKEEHIAIGTSLISLLCSMADLGFELEVKHVIAKKTKQPRYLVRMTGDKAKKVTEAIQQGLTRAADLEPMVCPPRDWIANDIGGYLTNDSQAVTRIGTHSMVRGLMEKDDWSKMPKVVAALNKAQSTAWKINQDVLKVFNWAYANDGLKSYTGMLPVDTTGSRTMLRHYHKVANELVQYPEYWVPHNLCWRGRVMALPMFSFQGPDCVRGLFVYSNEVELGENGLKWISMHIANNYGHGFEKAPLVDRFEFAFKYHDKIIKFAKLIRKALDGRVSPERANSILNRTKHIWCVDTEAPYLLLAACLEWYAIHEEGKRTSNVPVGFDGANNAIQHGSSFLRDAEGAAWVNVCAASIGDKPADLYTAVAKQANEMLEKMVADNDSDYFSKSARYSNAEWAKKWLDYGVKRKTCKRIVMTRGYAGSMYGASDMIMDDIIKKDENHPFGADARLASVFLGQLVHRAAMAVLSGLARSMQYLQTIVAERANAETEPLVYVHPETGYIFRQAYYKKKVKRVNMRSLPGPSMSLALSSDEKKIDVRKMAAGVSANFTHSNDAAHLMMTTLACDFDLGLVHDSFSAHPGNCEDLFRIVREQFVKLHSNELLKVIGEHNKKPDGSVVPLPEYGTLDVGVTLNAPYAFV